MIGKCQKRADFSRYKLMPSELDSKKKSVLTGLLLGDGHIPSTSGRHNCFAFEQSDKHSEYVDLIFELLSPYTDEKSIKTVVNDKTKWGKSIYLTKRFRTWSHPVFSELRKKWYKNVKIVPDDLVLDWTTMSFWFADDGHSRKGGKELTLCSQSFTKEENMFLVDKIKTNLGIRSALASASGGTGTQIRILSADYFKFMDGVYPIIKSIKCFAHKIDTSGATQNSTPRYSTEDKQNALKLIELGWTFDNVASSIGCHSRTIKRWANV